MFVELKKVEFVNKGAELMLHAIKDKISNRFPHARFVMEPEEIYRPYEKRAEQKFYQKASLYKYRIQWGNIAQFLPKQLLLQYGIIPEKLLNIVLDSSGFSYSDQWGPGGTIKLSKESIRYKRNGTKLILLPQAFGPFTSPSINRAIKIIADNSCLIFARDQVSYEHLINTVGNRPNIKIAPDFTILLNGIPSEYLETTKNSFCIIPNSCMLDKTSKEQSELYLPFMKTCIDKLLNKNKKVFLLVHESENDLMLANQICSSFKTELPIIQESNPLKLKGIIGTSGGVIGSRFHGLVSALSQGIPSLAVGWSHKYATLFNEFDFSEGVIDIKSRENEIEQKLELIIDTDTSKEVKCRLLRKSSLLKSKVEEMWELIYQHIEM